MQHIFACFLFWQNCYIAVYIPPIYFYLLKKTLNQKFIFGVEFRSRNFKLLNLFACRLS